MSIVSKIEESLPEWQERVTRLKRDFPDLIVGQVSVDQILSGIRGVQIGVSDISYVDPYNGVRLRGYTVPEVLSLLPKAEGSEIPLAGGLYYLLLTGELPTLTDALEVEEEWHQRAELPEQVYRVVGSMPAETHPMTLFSQALLALQPASVFARKYSDGAVKPDYWRYYLEDSLNLSAKLPQLAALVYNWKYRNGEQARPDPHLDWSANFAAMIGKGENEDYKDLMRLFFVLHSDHEGANVSAHISQLVASALSDVYLSSAAAMNGLAGPLHGLANQECLRWLLAMRDRFGGLPSEEELAQAIREQLAQGKLIPGYGHAVLRVTDPRFTAQLEFGRARGVDSEIFRLAEKVFEVAPPILAETGKVRNPWPNVDAINGALQYHYGVTQWEFYTVLFGTSRILGLTAHAVWARALMKPIERPKSLTTEILEEMAGIRTKAPAASGAE
jgi:citrate synthase